MSERYQFPCKHFEKTGCTGFSGGYDTYLCYKPCRLTYDMRTHTYFEEQL